MAHPTQPMQLISSSLDGTLKFWSVDDAVLLKTIDLSKSDHCGNKNNQNYAVRGVKGDF